MHKFKVGDRVVCQRPANVDMKCYKGKEGVVLKVYGNGLEGHLVLSAPFNGEHLYTPEQFDLVYSVEENE